MMERNSNDANFGAVCRSKGMAPSEDLYGGSPAGIEARHYADGPSTGNRRRPEAMIDRDVRDKERTSEHFELRSAQEVAARFASLPGSAGNASSATMPEA